MAQLPVLNGRAKEWSVANPIGEADRRALARDLVNAVRGEVRFDPHNRMLYATDASLYQVEPIGVVIPADIDDAAAAVEFCGKRGVPILPRGGGTSLGGQCTNHAVVIDMSVNCRRILEVDPAGQRARVEPGITVDDLNDELTRMGGEAGQLLFAADPATSRHANIGGCIGNNAAGSRSIRYGRTAENLIGVDCVLASGERVRFEQGSRDERVRDLSRRVLGVCGPIKDEILARFPKTIRRNAGYALDMMVKQAWGDVPAAEGPGLGGQAGTGGTPMPRVEDVNLAHLICGSEGTLAMVLEAELRLHAKPRAKGLAVIGFDALDPAIEVVGEILKTSPSAVELLDDLVISLARANTEYARYVDLMPTPSGRVLNAVLYVEYFGDTMDEIRGRFADLERLVSSLPSRPAFASYTDASAMLKAWKLRKAGEPLLHGVPGNRKPLTFVEDNAVPVQNLVPFVREFREIVTRHGTRAAFWAHASVGVLHVRPLLDLHDERDRVRLREIAIEVADLARRMGGVMSGEHGDGRVRGPLLERFFGLTIAKAFADVKATFDPTNIFNPGNIVPTPADPRAIESMTQRLRIEPTPKREVHVPNVDTYFEYADQAGFDHAVEMCNGAGVCRKKQGGTMCPSYMATLDERHSTRGRGNALRLAITGQLEELDGAAGGSHDEQHDSGAHDAARWNDAGTIETLDLCLSCKACKTECPSNVDIARLKAEYTAQRYRTRGAPLAAKLMGSIRTLNQMGSLAPKAANWMGSSWLGKKMARWMLGVDPRRSLPPFEESLSKKWAASERSRPGGMPVALHRHADAPAPTVALFGDCFTMHNEPSIGLAAKRVLEACGYRVVLADVGCCARAKISLGLLPQAIEEIDRTIARFASLIEREKVRAIVVAEPSCLSAIKDDWLALKCKTPLERRRALAALCFLPEDFLERKWDQHPQRPAFKPMAAGERVLLHGHCHQKALWGAETSAAALRRAFAGRVEAEARTPGGGVATEAATPVNACETLDTGCCGMAGAFGFAEKRFDLSMKIGELSLFPAVRAAGEKTIIAAPGTSCRHQVHDGTGKRALHPIEIIAQRLL